MRAVAWSTIGTAVLVLALAMQPSATPVQTPQLGVDQPGVPLFPMDVPQSLVGSESAERTIALPVASTALLADLVALSEGPLVVPAAAPIPQLDIFPTFWKYPRQTDDVSADGVGDWALTDGALSGGSDETTVVILSGADGVVLHSITYASDWAYWYASFQSRDESFAVIYTFDERFTVIEDDYEVWFWSATIHVVGIPSFEEVWSVGLDAALNDDGSGYVEYGTVGLPGRFADDAFGAVLTTGRYSWTDSIFNGEEETLEVGVRDFADGTLRYAIDASESKPHARVAAQTGDGFVALEAGIVEKRLGQDYALQWSLGPGELGFEPVSVRVVMVGDAPKIFVVGSSTEPGAQAALIDANGVVDWNRFLPGFWRFFADVGVSDANGATQIAFGHVIVDCLEESLYYRYGMFEAATGDRLWMVEETIDFPFPSGFGLYLSVGDHTGDGVSEIMFINATTTIESLVSEVDPCSGGTYYVVLDETTQGRVRLHDSGTGEAIYDWTLDEIPGGLVLPYDEPTTPVHGIPFVSWRIITSANWQLFYHELTVGRWYPETGDVESVIADARLFNPARVGGHYGLRGLSSVVDGPHPDRVGIFWYQSAGYLVDQYSRVGFYMHDLDTLDHRWTFESESPLDVRVPVAPLPLPPTPFG